MIDNIIDIHSHVIWHIDDGCRNFDMALEMCDCAEDSGTKTLFVTPHLMYWDKAEYLYDERERKYERLTEELYESGSQLTIKKGFEILCDDDIFNIKYFNPYTLNGSRYILIEFDFFKTTEEDVSAWCDYLLSFGLTPVMAHPERYHFLMNDITCVERFSEKGVLFQINAGSPVGAFGEREMNTACRLLECGYVDFMGSDAHNLTSRTTDITSFFEDYPYNIDLKQLEKITCENPLHIVNDTKYTPHRIKSFSDK